MDSHNVTEHDLEITRRLLVAADLLIVAGNELNAIVELHLAHLDHSSGVPSPATPDEIAETPGLEPCPPDPGLGTLRRVELIAEIRLGLDRLWPNNSHRQAAWLRGYLRPRGHDSLNLGSVDDELLVTLGQAIADLCDLLRHPEGVAAVEALHIDEDTTA